VQQTTGRGNYNKKLLNMKQSKIIILGDSHARGCTQEVQHNLECDFTVQGIAKVGADTETIVSTSTKITGQLKRRALWLCGEAHGA
jgi:superfamily I DNA and RNA helicase